MKILKRVPVPTGDICIGQGEKGKIEFLSIGDYGKDINLKCDAMGLDREPDQVRHTDLLPLTEKWVITISSQYGCSMNCNFCDVPKVGVGLNATIDDLIGQIEAGMSLHPEITASDRLNIHFARMGEPTFNTDVLRCAHWLNQTLNPKFHVHPVVSTMMPRKNKDLDRFLTNWMCIKDIMYEGNAGLQLSINSTDEAERFEMFAGNALTIQEIGDMVRKYEPLGRKITLNFAVADYRVDPELLVKNFDPEHFIIKLTPMHKTITALENGVKTAGDYTTYYPYQELEESLKAVGFDVLVFIASKEEDESQITCGNAILSG
jgi:23S rRNA (adenine2503-C2)-methyltransferase